MKYSNRLALYLLLAITTLLSTGRALFAATPVPSNTNATEIQLSQSNLDRELVAYSNSEYTYWDAAMLADYWGQDLLETKARMGRKILWGPADTAILEQFLVDARISALAFLESEEYLRFFWESSYDYDDAVALAAFWGDPTPWDAKLRIERNLIMGNSDEVVEALQYANIASF